VDNKLFPIQPFRNSGSTCHNYKGNIFVPLFIAGDAHGIIHAAVFASENNHIKLLLDRMKNNHARKYYRLSMEQTILKHFSGYLQAVLKILSESHGSVFQES
jgi:hypothetical protein